MRKTNPFLLSDCYKVSHYEQYDKKTQFLYSTWTPRKSKIEGIDTVVFFGLQKFIKEFLIDYFNEYFFSRDIDEVIEEYNSELSEIFFVDKVNTAHIEALHKLGYLPIKIKALPEGVSVPVKTPMFTIENTHEDFYWVPSFLETLISCEIWAPCTSATIAREYKKLAILYSNNTCDNYEHIPFQFHDFSVRGMTSIYSASSMGLGHLLSFTGSDNIPAITSMKKYYNPNHCIVGASVPATEHSVMSSYGKDNELETYRKLIEEIYPEGLISIVSDTWDLFNVVTSHLPKLKNSIMQRNGKVVIRPDSGNPVHILCGTEDDCSKATTSEEKGLIQLLWELFGGEINSKGYKVLDTHIGAIYGDLITLPTAKEIFDKLQKKGFASSNIVFGIGSMSYQDTTRDTFGFAMKCTHAIIDNKELNIFKDPKTDNESLKKSNAGRLVILLDENNNLKVIDNLNKQQSDEYENNLLQTIYLDGKLLKEYSLGDVRNNIDIDIERNL